MIEWTDELERQFRTVRIIALAMFVFAPLCYIFVAFQLDKQIQAGGQFDIMFYMLLILAMVQPTVNPLLEKFQIAVFKKKQQHSSIPVDLSSKMNIRTPFIVQAPQGTPMGLFTTLTIIKSAMVEAIYIYGMVVLFTSGDINRMFYFYPIGIAWTFVYFPTKSRCEKFLEKVSSNAIV